MISVSMTNEQVGSRLMMDDDSFAFSVDVFVLVREICMNARSEHGFVLEMIHEPFQSVQTDRSMTVKW